MDNFSGASLTPWFLSEFLLRSQLFSSYLYRINHTVRRQSETISVLVDREAFYYVIIGMSLQTLKIQILDGWNTKSWLISKLIALCRSGLMALSRSSSFRSFSLLCKEKLCTEIRTKYLSVSGEPLKSVYILS